MGTKCRSDVAANGCAKALFVLNEEICKLGYKPMRAWIGFGEDDGGEPIIVLAAALQGDENIEHRQCGAKATKNEFRATIVDLLKAVDGEQAASADHP